MGDLQGTQVQLGTAVLLGMGVPLGMRVEMADVVLLLGLQVPLEEELAV
jgi:hypothetical protein